MRDGEGLPGQVMPFGCHAHRFAWACPAMPVYSLEEMAPTRSYLTIVSGLPRSGTSLMMQMLVAGGIPALTDGIRQPDEDNPRGYYEFEPVKHTRVDPSWLAAAAGKAVKMVHLLLYDLPAGHSFHVIFMKRRLEEVLASQRTMLERQGKKGADLSASRLGEVFQGQLNKLDVWLAEQRNFSVRHINYNELIADPAAGVEAINQFLDGGLDTIAMAKAVDPLLYRIKLP
jgi:hypothetical protein